MLARLVGELVPAAKCTVSLSSVLKNLTKPSGLTAGSNAADLESVYSDLVAPCLTARTSILVSERGANETFLTVSVKFHDHPNLIIPEYFSGLGYILSLQAYGTLSLSQRITLLALYAKVCKLSAPLVNSRPPTTVQLLWINSPQLTDTRVVLGSSLAWTKVRSHFQMARAVREGTLGGLWRDSLINPTPMQTRFPNPIGALFGTCWGDCAEAISLSAFWKLVASGTPLSTLALNVASMNAVDPLTELSACDMILENNGNLSLQEILGILLRANAFRPMCKNCEHLRDTVGAHIVDCACFEYWLQLGLFMAPKPQAILARA